MRLYIQAAYLTYIQSTSCEMPGWMKHKLESRLPGEISITSDTQMTPPLWQKMKKSLLKQGKEGSGKVGLKLSIQKTQIMASSPITSRQINRETMKTVTDFIFLGSNVTADGDCSHESKSLGPCKKSYAQPLFNPVQSLSHVQLFATS